MTRSIRTRLLLWMIGGMAVLLGIFAVVVYEFMHRSLVGGFDEVLISTTRTICGFVEQDDQEIKVETDERELPEFYRAARPDYFQVWAEQGETVSRSPSPEEADLERFEGPLDSFVFRSVRLPDGRPGRAVSLFFVPKVDEEAGDIGTPRKVILVVARETGALDSEIAFLRSLLGAATGGSIILALLMGVVVVRQGLRPLRTLASRIAAIREDDLSVRIPIDPMPAEMVPVAQRLNDLLHRLEEAFYRERAFTADAAHELRTPLAGLRSVIEVALARPRVGDDYRQAMTECLDIVRHTQTMIDNLLALARLDSGQTTLRPETICLSEVITTAWRPLADRIAARRLSVDRRVPTDLAFRTDRDNLALTLTVLLTNAVEYSDDDGQIEVAARQVGALVELTVANSGCTLSDESARHVFERFWRADASRTNTGIHCGLGLAIAKRIVTSLGGTIAASVNGDIFVVRVILPVSPA
jgi:two-component system heavy metal sensor histidine kinase CusS